MSEPLVITISHKLGRAEAKRRIAGGMDQIRGAIMPFVSTLDTNWDGDRLLFHVAALQQRVEGSLGIEDELVRIEIMAPFWLRLIAGRVAGRIRREGTRLLRRPAIEP